jgi:hypothetical protein
MINTNAPKPLGTDSATAPTLATTTKTSASADAVKLAEIASRQPTAAELSQLSAGR